MHSLSNSTHKKSIIFEHTGASVHGPAKTHRRMQGVEGERVPRGHHKSGPGIWHGGEHIVGISMLTSKCKKGGK